MTTPYDDSLPAVVISGGDAAPARTEGDFVFACRMTGPQGWINLDDHERYIVGAESFATSATTWRRVQVQGPYVAGKFTVSAVPDQVTENVTVYVLGSSQSDLQANLAALIDAVSQPYFQFVFSIDETSYIWDCDCADYTVAYTTATLNARQITVKLQILRHPLLTMGTA
jgi:hypothetical protein